STARRKASATVRTSGWTAISHYSSPVVPGRGATRPRDGGPSRRDVSRRRIRPSGTQTVFEARISQFGARYSFGQGGGSVPRPGPFPPRRVGTPDDASRAVATGPAATGPWSAALPRRPGPWSHARGADGAASLA